MRHSRPIASVLSGRSDRTDGDVTISGNLFVGGALIASPNVKHAHQIVLAGVVALDQKRRAVVTLPKDVDGFSGEVA